MTRTAHQALEAERERAQRAQDAVLTAHYRSIGSAALLAALLCAQQKQATAEQEEKAEKAA